MIEYLTTINSHTAATRIVSIPVDDDAAFIAGAVCSVSDGKLSQSYTTGLTAYLTLSEKNSGDGKTSIDCIRLEVGMVLKAMVNGGTNTLKFGDHIDFTTDALEYFAMFNISGSSLEVIDTDGTNATVIINKI